MMTKQIMKKIRNEAIAFGVIFLALIAMAAFVDQPVRDRLIAATTDPFGIVILALSMVGAMGLRDIVNGMLQYKAVKKVEAQFEEQMAEMGKMMNFGEMGTKVPES